MRLTLFGASGRTGRQITAQALERGHAVTAVARSRISRDELDGTRPTDAPGSLEVRVLDLADPRAVAGAVSGADAVVCTVGPRGTGPTSVQTDVARTALSAMEATGVRRLVAVSAAGFHTEGDGRFVRGVVKPVLGRVLRHSFADQRAMESLITASGTDWTLMWPPRLTDGPRTAAYRSSMDRNVRGSFSVSRANLAQAVLDALENPATIGRAVAVAD